MTTSRVIESVPLGFQWPTLDPFLFCVHHDDRYPKGNGAFGPAASLAGRNLGQDFEPQDGWRMYHGQAVPGFPQHPHRGFETVTLARHGHIDHSDSLGAAARFGQGDVQWLTAGGGIVHSEMFPLLDTTNDNRVELFQIWLNLPRVSKMAAPHFSIFWAEKLPVVEQRDEHDRAARITVVAGAVGGATPLAPPPSSYAANPASDVAIWTLTFDANARVTLPAARDPKTLRMLYFFAGEALSLDGEALKPRTANLLRPGAPMQLVAGEGPVECLVLQGRPLEEPVAHYGPFVMNTRAELQEAVQDYQRTEFGGWRWPSDEPVHGSETRFARYPDGRMERP